MTAAITIIKSTRPAVLCKRYTKIDGKLKKHAVAHVTAGTCRTLPAATAHEMVRVLAEVTESTDLCIVPGAWRGADDAPFELVTEDALCELLQARKGEVEGGVHRIGQRRVGARLKRGIDPSCWMLIDADNPPGIPAAWAALSLPERLVMMEPLIPGISSCERIELRGSSARVVNGSGEAGQATHAWVRVNRPDKIEALKARVAVEMVNRGLAFPSPRYSRTDPDKVIGHEQRTVIDLSVWTTGRIVFNARPDLGTGMDAYTVADPGIVIVNEGAGELDISGVTLPGQDALHVYRERTGIVLTMKAEGGVPRVDNEGQLTMDTEIVCRGVTKTLREWVAGMPPGGKLRCEAPFRASESEAAVIRLQSDGTPVVHDVGNGTTYKLGAGTAIVIDDDTVILEPPDFSDDRLALDFVQAYGAGHRWSPGLGWMTDTGIVWKRDDILGRYDLARRVCRAAAAGANKPDEQKRLTSAKTVNAVLSLAQSDQRIVVPATAWDGAPTLLNTPGGVVDLRTGSLRERRHDDFVTQAARVAPDYSSGAEVFERFLQDVFAGDNEIVDFVQRMLGYCLTGERREQVLFFWHGSGANGKSTLLDLVQWMLDTYALKLPAAALMVSRNERHPTELAQLRGKRMAISSELEEGQFWNEALIKELTGDEVLTARFMRQDFFEFTMTQKHVIVGNHKPRLRGGDPAIARRLVLVPFEVKFEGAKRDRGMLDKLKAEAPAILTWLIQGAVRWYRDGLQVPERVRAAGAQYLADHDDIALWMDECCIRGGEALAGELYASFRHWKESGGEHAPSQKTWSQRLQAVPGISRRRSSGIRYAGIELNEREERRVRYTAGNRA